MQTVRLGCGAMKDSEDQQAPVVAQETKELEAKRRKLILKVTRLHAASSLTSDFVGSVASLARFC